MSAASVQVLCPNGRRCNIKVNGDTTLLQVLEEACAKQKFDPALYNLKYQRSVVDLSLPYRFSNMPNNAKLEMVEAGKRRSADGQVAIAVQLEDGTRKQATVPSTSSLWSVLGELGLAAGPSEAMEPVIVFMRREVSGRSSLEQSTLSSIGVTSGTTAVLRLLFRQLNKSSDERSAQSEAILQTDQQVHQPVSSNASDQQVHQPVSSHGSEQECSNMDVECGGGKHNGEKQMEGPGHNANPADKDVQTSGQDVHQVDTQETVSTGDQEAGQHSPAAQPMELDHGNVGEVLDEPMFPLHPFRIFPDEVTPREQEQIPVKRRKPGNDAASVTGEVAANEERTGFAHMQNVLFKLITSQAGRSQQSAAVESQSGTSVSQLAPEVTEPCDRETVVLRREDLISQGGSAAAEPSDDFFEVTIDDVRLMHSDLKKQLADVPLQTEAMRKTQQARMLERYKKAVVRVCFPDLWILQGTFRPGETLKALVKFVREHLADPSVCFYLYTSPPKTVLRNGKVTFLEAGFVPSAIVYVGSETSPPPSLSSQCLSLWKGKRPEEVTSVNGASV